MNVKELTPEQIEWCNEHIIEKWWVNDKGEVEVEEVLSIKKGDYAKFPVKFADVKGDFQSYNRRNLTSLEGAPSRVGEDFWCENHIKLTSLEGAPSYVGGDFYCYRCTNLTSLEGAPYSVRGDFYCYRCTNLTSLEGAPSYVGGDFYCYRCTNLTSLEGAPYSVRSFDCNGCKSLTTLKSSPIRLKENFLYHNCPEIPKEEIDFYENTPELFRDWLKTGLSFTEYQEKYRGKIIGNKFGL